MIQFYLQIMTQMTLKLKAKMKINLNPQKKLSNNQRFYNKEINL